MEGVGFTVIVNVVGVPGHPLAVGVAVIVEMIGDEVAFIPVNEAIFPVPLAPKPLVELSFGCAIVTGKQIGRAHV